MSKLSLQYISDIHLEFFKHDEEFEIIPHSPNLALCGDIGYPGMKNYSDFIDKCSQLFKNVFVIFGNHEYYNKSGSVIIETMEIRKRYTRFFPKNVYFLDNTMIYLDIITNTVYKYKPNDLSDDRIVKIIGSTLWTDVDYYTSLRMNDVNLIYNYPTIKLTGADVRKMYCNSIDWIIEEIQSEKNVKCVLLTHHGTHPDCLRSDSPRNLLKTGYVNMIPELYNNTNLLACISGHTHNSIKSYINVGFHKIHLLSNQVCYKHERKFIISNFFGFTHYEYDYNDKSNCLFEYTIEKESESELYL